MFAFAGLMAVAPDMTKSLDRFLDDRNSYDLRIISTLGLDPEDVDAVKSLSSIEDAEGVLYRDSPVFTAVDEGLVNINSLPDNINRIEITSGRLPEKQNEIAVEKNFLKVNKANIGDVVHIDDPEGFYETDVTITGVVDSPLYYNSVDIDSNRGHTNVGSGIINFYAYVPKSNFKADYISTIYATVAGAGELTTGSDEYNDLIDAAKDDIESIRGERQKSRYDSVMKTAGETIDEKSDTAKAELEIGKEQLDGSLKLLEDAGLKIEETEGELARARRLLDEGLATLREKKSELDSGKAKLAAGKITLDEKQKQADEGAALIAAAEKELEAGAAELEAAKTKATEGKKEIELREAQISEGEAKLEEGRKELAEGKEQLDTAKATLGNFRSEYNSIVNSGHLTEDIINSEKQRLKADIDATNATFDKLLAEYRNGTLTLERAEAIISEAISSYTREPTVLERAVFYSVAIAYLESAVSEGEAKYNDGLAQLKDGETQLAEGKKALEEGKKQYEDGLVQIMEGEKKLSSGRAQLEDKKKELESGLAMLATARAEYDAAIKTLADGEKLLQDGYSEYYKNEAAYNDGKNQLEEGKDAYDAGYAAYLSGLGQYEAGRANFDEEIRKAREGLLDVDAPTWYTYDRSDYQTYADYFDSANSMSNLSKAFPIVFFLVAILVSLTSMARMVEMDRIEIGTLKSMGYSREKVITKYAFFSILATLAGSALGGILGLIIMPSVIFSIYGILFDIPKFYLSPNWGPTLIGFGTVMVLVVGAGMLKAVQVMREKPAELLRPKAPKPGKRVLLERITPIWKKLRFSDKITVRNLFRYKRRLFVTVFGITGCTALILCGFGIKDAIVDIPERQFGHIFDLDALAYLTGMDNSEKDSKKLADIFDEEEITGYTETRSIKCLCGDYELSILAFENTDDIKNVLSLSDVHTGEVISPEPGKAVITNKLSRLTGLKEGDEISLTDLDHRSYKFTISGITNNHFDHYIIIDKNTLEEFTEYAPNLFYLKTVDMTEDEKEDLTRRLLSHPEVLNITYKEKLVEGANDMLTSLDKVVVILILLSAALSLVVLYNLSNININERHREIATLKVLGFYDKEVDDYINRENVIVTIIGIAAGLLIGIVFTKVVVSTIEIEKASFINHIKPLSFVYAAAMSAAFTVLVNFATHFNLRKINMIDSLKSVD